MAISLHADRKLPALVDGGRLDWLPSPEPGVERRMLERSGDEVALATTLVRYAPNSRFPAHSHALGEEFLVLTGTFSDEDGDYPPGTYVRNPPGSRHAPFSREGCVILVKLRQMTRDEPEKVRVFAGDRRWVTGSEPGVERALLYANGHSSVELVRLAAGAELRARQTAGGEECFVIEGEVIIARDAQVRLTPWTWSRDASPEQPAVRTSTGALLWIKRGHL
jgi:anti-sigma factor ChrR (cupin superfamily)